MAQSSKYQLKCLTMQFRLISFPLSLRFPFQLQSIVDYVELTYRQMHKMCTAIRGPVEDLFKLLLAVILYNYNKLVRLAFRHIYSCNKNFQYHLQNFQAIRMFSNIFVECGIVSAMCTIFKHSICKSICICEL